jgi:hypothetical protein
MLVPRFRNPPAVDVPLGQGASIRVRAATTMEVERATGEVGLLVQGLVAGAESAMTASVVLGEEFRSADFTDMAWLTAAAKRLALLKLATKCCESWSGIGDENGAELALNEQNLALLLRDPKIARLISNAIEAPVHAEIAEKNGFTASLNGGAAAEEPIAPNADAQTSPVPAA